MIMEPCRYSADSRDDRGAVLVWVGLMIVILLGMGAFAVDFGYAYATKRQLSTSADAAALSGAQAAGANYVATGGCQLVGSAYSPTSTYANAIRTAARTTFTDNDVAGANALQDSEIAIRCLPAAGPVDTVDVSVAPTSTLPTFLGRVLGQSTLNLGEAATAELGGYNFPAGLRPLAVCIDDVTAAAGAFPNPDVKQTNYGVKTGGTGGDASSGPCVGGVPGNWGLVDFDWGNNSFNNIECLLRDGYQPNGPCGPANPVLGGDPGVTAPDDSAYTGSLGSGVPQVAAMDAAMNASPIYLPVTQNWDGTGANANYLARGVVTVEICGWARPQNPAKAPAFYGFSSKNLKLGCWEDDLYEESMTIDAGADSVLGTSDDTIRKEVDFVVQWRLTEAISSYPGTTPSGEECNPFTDWPTCRRVVSLTQ